MIKSTQNAQQLAKQQMEFAAAISHELRTPLAIICAAGENLADGLIHDLPKAQQYGSVIYGEGRRLADMIEQVLDFASTQSGQKTYQLLPVNINKLVEDAMNALQSQLNDNGFTVQFDLHPNLPMILGDEVAIKRSLQNLINNAIKYSGATRWIGVQTQFQRGSRGFEVLVSIQDQGIGIASADLPHIFEPFYRGQNATSAHIHGSGLGLNLVKHAVTAHGGRISVSNKPDRGVIFTLYLPAIEEYLPVQTTVVGGQV